MAHAIIRGANGRRHEVDFEGADITVEVFFGDETVESPHDPAPSDKRRLSLLNSGFCVLRVKARGQRDLITVIGHAATIGAGEFVQASGRWVNDRTHGVQFRADFLRSELHCQAVQPSKMRVIRPGWRIPFLPIRWLPCANDRGWPS